MRALAIARHLWFGLTKCGSRMVGNLTLGLVQGSRDPGTNPRDTPDRLRRKLLLRPKFLEWDRAPPRRSQSDISLSVSTLITKLFLDKSRRGGTQVLRVSPRFHSAFFFFFS